MSNQTDEMTFAFLEKVVYYAQEHLEKERYIKPFVMLLNDTEEVELFENDETDTTKSYALLEEQLHQRLHKKDVSMVALVTEGELPVHSEQKIKTNIRVHLEEKSQSHNPIGARFLYVPYQLRCTDTGTYNVQLHAPIPIGLASEYLKSNNLSK